MRDDKSYVCTHVLLADRPVLYACREGGDLVLACGGDDHEQSTDDWKVVHAEHLVDLDATLHPLGDLADGEQAERSAVGQAWLVSPIAD